MSGRKVVCAALRHRETKAVVTGARHFDKVMLRTIAMLKEGYGEDWSRAEQGFIDTLGNFLTREEAMSIAKNAGQPVDIERCGGSETKLFSEGLY